MQTSLGSRRWIVLLAVAALLAASCGDDSGADESSTTSSTTTTVADVDPPDDPEEIPLTDSFRGVTADTITLGYTAIDFELLNTSFGLDLAFKNFGPQADAVVGWYNDNGGVLGRKMELIHETYLPVGSTSADGVCVRLTEDVDVFAVLAGFAGPGAREVNTCFTEIHETILVGPSPTTEQGQEAGGLWVSTDMSLDRRNVAVARLMSEAGVLDDLGPMMVIGSNGDEAALVAGMADALRDAGVDIPITDVVTTTGDQPATNTDVNVWIERARSAGVSTVVLLGEGEFRNIAFFSNAPDFTYIMGNGDALTDWQSIPPEGLQSATRVLTNNNGPDRGIFDDPDFLDCLNAVEAAQGITVLPTSELPEGDPNYFSGTVGTCRTIGLFVQIAEAAGPDLTNESWIAALDKLPDLTIPGFDFVSLSSQKVDARDQLVLVEYDLDMKTFVPISEPIDVG